MAVLDFLKHNQWMYKNILEVGFDGVFNHILSLMEQTCGCQFNQINIVEQTKHWRKTDTGLWAEPCDKTKELSELVINENGFLEITDILDDHRVIDKNLFINANRLRYFSGMPLISSDGHILGTLSLMGCEPCRLSEDKKSVLTLLANNVVTQIELHLKNFELEKTLHQYEIALDAPTEFISPKLKITRDSDEFLFRALHDLKSPLNAIKNVTSWIEEDIESGNKEDNSKNFLLLRNSIRRMEQLSADLIKYSQVGREVFNKEPLDFKNLVYESCNMVEVPKGFHVTVDSCDVVLPKVPLFFVLNQLISNAVKHHDGDDGIIDIVCTTHLNHYQITVSDDGPGIPLAYQHKVFDPFHKLKSKDEVEGSGLGLAMVRKTLGLYFAEINVKSTVDMGTTFTVLWPLNRHATDKTE